MLDPKITAIAKRLLPSFIRVRLDPFDDRIVKLTSALAAQVSNGTWILDAGAGEARFKELFSKAHYVAVDAALGDPSWDYSRISVLADLHRLPFKAGSFDHVLCIVVLEHVREPGKVLEEFNRVLRPGGKLHAVVPLLWEEHQKPHDFYRFTSHGISYLLDKAEFHAETLEPVGGFFWVLGRRCVNLLTFFQSGWRKVVFLILAPFFGLLFPLICYYLDRLDKQREFTLGYALVASKPET